nr:hypothetical protein [Tanacetum cinerariifolium]
MSYDDIRPIFKAKFNFNIEFLLKTKKQIEEDENRAIESINETPAQKPVKRRKMNEDVEDLKQHLEIVPDEDNDVYTEATLLARKGKKYDEILPIFQAKFDANMRFLFNSREEMEKEAEEIIKSINETPAQKAAKRRKLTTLLAQKVPVIDYQIVVIDNKPKYKIIRADDTHQFYISFTTLLKNFDREDMETL